jgi:hypothetical protein
LLAEHELVVCNNGTRYTRRLNRECFMFSAFLIFYVVTDVDIFQLLKSERRVPVFIRRLG